MPKRGGKAGFEAVVVSLRRACLKIALQWRRPSTAAGFASDAILAPPPEILRKS
jgi:hypothetical protein